MGENTPTQKIVWGIAPTLYQVPSSKILLHSYYLTFITFYLQLSPISVETMFA